jgi:hypothetical protein
MKRHRYLRLEHGAMSRNEEIFPTPVRNKHKNWQQHPVLSTARSNYAASWAGGGEPNLASNLVLVYVHLMGLVMGIQVSKVRTTGQNLLQAQEKLQNLSE